MEPTSASFTAFDFLGPTPEGDEVIRRRYGPRVLAALRRDRRAVVRDIFGTRPYHVLPRHERAFNVYRFFRRYLAGAKILLLPLVQVAFVIRLVRFGIGHVLGLVAEVLGKKKVRRTHLSRFANFEVALRKIHRMRKPLFMEALRLRAAIDVEYLGLRLPDSGPRRPDERERETFSDHLDFIGAIDGERRPIVRLRERAVEDLRRLRVFLDEHGWRGEGFDEMLDRFDATGTLRRHRGEVLRAIVTAYVTDHGGLRSTLTATEWMRRFVGTVASQGDRGLVEGMTDRIRSLFSRVLPTYRRRRRLFMSYVGNEPGVAGLDKRLERRVLAEILRADQETENMLAHAERNLRSGPGTETGAIVEALHRAAADYRLWTRKLVTIRTIQTLTLLDVRSYRELVWRVGEYEHDERVPG